MLNTPLRVVGREIVDADGKFLARAVTRETAIIIVNFVNAAAAS